MKKFLPQPALSGPCPPSPANGNVFRVRGKITRDIQILRWRHLRTLGTSENSWCFSPSSPWSGSVLTVWHHHHLVDELEWKEKHFPCWVESTVAGCSRFWKNFCLCTKGERFTLGGMFASVYLQTGSEAPSTEEMGLLRGEPAGHAVVPPSAPPLLRGNPSPADLLPANS